MGKRRGWGSPVHSPHGVPGLTAKQTILQFDKANTLAPPALGLVKDSPSSARKGTVRSTSSPDENRSSSFVGFIRTESSDSSRSCSDKKPTTKPATKPAQRPSTAPTGRNVKEARRCIATCIKELKAGPVMPEASEPPASTAVDTIAQQAKASWQAGAAAAIAALNTASKMQQLLDLVQLLKEVMALHQQRKFCPSMDKFAELMAQLQPLALQERQDAAAGAPPPAATQPTRTHQQQPATTAAPGSPAKPASSPASGRKPSRLSWGNSCHSNALFDMSPDASTSLPPASPPSNFRLPQQHITMRRLSMALAATIAEEGSPGKEQQQQQEESQQRAHEAPAGLFEQLQDQCLEWFTGAASQDMCSTQGISSVMRCDHLLKALGKAQDWIKAQQQPAAAQLWQLQQQARLAQLEVAVRNAMCELGVLKTRLADVPAQQRQHRASGSGGLQGMQALRTSRALGNGGKAVPFKF